MKYRTLFLGATLFLIGALVLTKTWRYYGHLLSGWDAQFYYAQGRAIAFEGTWDITHSLESTPFKDPFGANEYGFFTRPPRSGSRIVNKYPLGLSLLEIPLMLIGEAALWLFGSGTEPAAPSGYSSGTIACVAFGLLLVTVLGLCVLHRLLESYYSFWPALLGVLAAWWGTSLLYYSAIFPFMAHGVGFTLVVLVLWQTDQLRHSAQLNWQRVGLLAASFGLLFLVRPQQILLLPIAVPFLIAPILRSKHAFALALLGTGIFGAICSVQIAANYCQLGTFSMNAYSAGNEGFNWFHPDFYTVLVSPARGLLWMNPILFLALAGIIFLRPHFWFEYVVLCHAIVQVYLIACWSSPEQGESFGPRMWIECTPLIAVGVAKLLATVRSFAWWVGFAFYSAAVSWTLVLMVLYLYLRDVLESSSHVEILRRVISLDFH